MKKFRLGLIGLIFSTMTTGVSAQHSILCGELNTALGSAHSDEAYAEVQKVISSKLRPLRNSCGFSINLSGSRSANCNWKFHYRAPEAKEVFNDMLQKLSACINTGSTITPDQQVNHPDFYDLRVLRLSEGEIGLSLKDKAILQETYIFLRITPTPQT